MIGKFFKRIRFEHPRRKWDGHFEKWVEEARNAGEDPNDVGDRYWANDGLDQVLQERYLQYIPAENSTVLELGPGSGRLTRHLLGSATRLELIDNSKYVIDWLNDYLTEHKNVRAKLIDKCLVPHLSNDSVDLVVSHGVFEHLDFDETYDFLVDFHRVLKPNGRVSFNYNTVHNEQGQKWLVDHHRKPGARMIFRFYTPDFMIRLCETAGFEIERSYAGEDRLAHLVLKKSA